MKNAFGYCRVSTARQESEGTSMDTQQAAIQAYFDYKLGPHGFKFGGWFRDPGKSGLKPFRHRPAGSQLVTLASEGDAVIFAKLDRGFRSTQDMLENVQRWKALKVGVHLLDLSVDTTTELGVMLITVVAAVAQMERSMIIERTTAGKKRRQADGYFMGGAPPYGYSLTGPPKFQVLVPRPEQRAYGARIVENYRNGINAHDSFLMFTQERYKIDGRVPDEKMLRSWYHRELKLQEAEQQAALSQTPAAV